MFTLINDITNVVHILALFDANSSSDKQLSDFRV